MKAIIQRLRAEIQSDRAAWLARVDELRALDVSQGDAGVLAQAAVALHHGYGAVESASALPTSAAVSIRSTR